MKTLPGTELHSEGRSQLEELVRDGAQRMLVLVGLTKDGQKELVGVQDGSRESEQSRQEFLGDLKQGGLKKAPRVAMGDGALGFWAALREVSPSTREQRCGIRKAANILNRMPSKGQPN